VEHLGAVGRRRIAFVGGPAGLRQVRDRRAGAQQAVDAIAGARLEAIDTPALTVLAGRSAGEQIRDRPAAARPDAVFCANDLLAIGVLQALTLIGGVRVPEDVALIGYDDIDFASSAVVPLSSIRQPTARIGATAVDLLISAAEKSVAHRPEHVVFQPQLVVRASTGGPAQ
jgi:LacI family transcriptional regulator